LKDGLLTLRRTFHFYQLGRVCSILMYGITQEKEMHLDPKDG
jgi:hypothetical protein